MKRIVRDGKEYAVLPCPECKKGPFLYPLSPNESKGFCDQCGHTESFRTEKKNDLRKGKK